MPPKKLPRKPAHWTAIVGALAAVAAVIIALIALLKEGPGIDPGRIEFRISSPSDGSVVGQYEAIEGQTLYRRDRNCYLIVTPLETGDDWVQAGGPLKVEANWKWKGSATFGDVNSSNKKFKLQALATKEELRGGKLERPPLDAEFSNSVTVTRR